MLLGLVPALRIESLRPRRRIVQTVGADLTGVPVVVDLPDARRVIPVVLEELRQRDHVRQDRAEVLGEVINLRRVRPAPRHERRPAGGTQRELAVRAIEPDPAPRQAIQVRCLDHRMAVATEGVVHVVGGDEEHVRAGGRGRNRAGQRWRLEVTALPDHARVPGAFEFPEQPPLKRRARPGVARIGRHVLDLMRIGLQIVQLFARSASINPREMSAPFRVLPLPHQPRLGRTRILVQQGRIGVFGQLLRSRRTRSVQTHRIPQRPAIGSEVEDVQEIVRPHRSLGVRQVPGARGRHMPFATREHRVPGGIDRPTPARG